jgi:hypothetical protein
LRNGTGVVARVTGATGRPWKEAKPTLVVAIGKMPKMAEWPDYGTLAQLGKHWLKHIQYVFSIRFTSHKGRNSPRRSGSLVMFMQRK